MAVDHFYAVNGSLAGSWKGLDKDVGIVNWHGRSKRQKLQILCRPRTQSILSGYYDHDESGAEISEWFQNTKDIPGIIGACTPPGKINTMQ